jgi:capsid protein
MTATASPIVDANGNPFTRTPMSSGQHNRISAHYDGAQTTPANANYWASADGMSARAAHSPAVRKTLRDRARYEVANNCYAKGMLRTQADYVIGTGPRLQLITEDKEFNRAVSRLFYEWAETVSLARKLWTMRFSWGVDGESFAEFVNNDAAEHPVKLDLMLVETDQISDGIGGWNIDWRRDDGVIIDKFGNITGYKKLPYHPGDATWWALTAEPIVLQKRDVIHLYRVERPGQHRGVTEIAPALMLYPGLRRWTYAALESAEKAARIGGIFKSNFTPVEMIERGGVPVQKAFENAPTALDMVELEASTFLTLPEGWDLHQLESEQPTATYAMFKRELVSEMARCLNMPFGIAAADSSSYNFASGKLDLMPWGRSIAIDQLQFSEVAVSPVFRRWYYEARRIDGYLPIEPSSAAEVKEWVPQHAWQWDGQKAIDPREAGARETMIKAGLSTFSREYAERGLDVKEEWEAEAELLQITMEEYVAAKWANSNAESKGAESMDPERSEKELEDAVAS